MVTVSHLKLGHESVNESANFRAVDRQEIIEGDVRQVCDLLGEGANLLHSNRLAVTGRPAGPPVDLVVSI